MAEVPLAQAQKQRLESLDVFRGVTIAGMVLVNNPGSWGAMYQPLTHAQWDGCTPTDLIFPFFLFIVGVAMTFSMDRRIKAGGNNWSLFAGVLRRSVLLILLGLILTGFPNLRMIGPYLLTMAGLALMYRTEPIFTLPTEQWERRLKLTGFALTVVAILWFLLDFGHFNGPNKKSTWDWFPLRELDGGYIRVPGVLQRIGLAFFFAALIMMFTGTRGRIIWSVGLLLGYWAIMKLIQAPEGYEIGMGGGRRGAPEDAPFPGTLNDWIDVKLLGKHLYSERPDPEGLLSTIPTISTVLFGILTGTWLHQDVSQKKKAGYMLLAAIPLLVIGWLWAQFFPLNKKIWSSSFIVYTTGWGLVFFSVCYFLNDVKGWRAWSKPLVIFGTNPILVFFGSGLMARMMGMISWKGEERTWSIKSYLYVNFFEGPFDPGKNASLAFAIFYILLWLAITYPLYRKKIFLKV